MLRVIGGQAINVVDSHVGFMRGRPFLHFEELRGDIQQRAAMPFVRSRRCAAVRHASNAEVAEHCITSAATEHDIVWLEIRMLRTFGAAENSKAASVIQQ